MAVVLGGVMTPVQMELSGFRSREEVAANFGSLLYEAIGEIVSRGPYYGDINPHNSPLAGRLNEAEGLLMGRELRDGETPIAVIIKESLTECPPPDVLDMPRSEFYDYMRKITAREREYVPAGQPMPGGALGDFIADLVLGHRELQSLRSQRERALTESMRQTASKLSERAKGYLKHQPPGTEVEALDLMGAGARR